MGVSLVSPNYVIGVSANGESPVQPKEYWGIPDNGQAYNYFGTYSVTTTLTLLDADETLGSVVAQVGPLSGVNSINGTNSADCNGTDAHDVRIEATAAGTATLHSTFTGVPYARVALASGVKHPCSTIGGGAFREWPRGVYYNHSGAWHILH